VPEPLSLTEYRALSASARTEYDERRRTHHASLGPYALGGLKNTVDRIERLISANERLPAERIRAAACIDGDPGLGKTTVAQLIGKRHHQTLVAKYGEFIDDGLEQTEYWPTAFVPLPQSADQNRGGVSALGFNQRFAKWYDLVYPIRESATLLTARIVDAIERAGTSLVIVDDLHYVNQKHLTGTAFNNHLKNLMNETCATFLFVGVGLERSGFFKEGRYADDAHLAQLGTRVRRFAVEPSSLAGEGIKEWRALLQAVRDDLILLEPVPPFDRATAEYLHARTQGSIGALVDLIRVAAEEAISQEAATRKPVLFDQAFLEGVELAHTTEARAPQQLGKATRRRPSRVTA
jgi:hypothetical protein